MYGAHTNHARRGQKEVGRWGTGPVGFDEVQMEGTPGVENGCNLYYNECIRTQKFINTSVFAHAGESKSDSFSQ